MTEPAAKRRRVELTLKDKIGVISDAERVPKLSLRDISAKYGIGKSTVSDILKKKDVYLREFEKNADIQKQRFNTKCSYNDLNELTWRWFCQARAKNIPLSGPIIQEKAMKFAADLNFSEFKASNGWLESFKSRHSIRAFKLSGESASVDMDIVDDFKERVPEIVSDFEPCDIFNCDETGLYWRALPDKTLSAKGESSKGVKNSRERITVLLACSATGEKLRPLVIGKAENPRCFKNVNKNNLPVQWSWNKNAWMNSKLFNIWIKSVDLEMKKKKRKILMFLDNATSHVSVKLNNVTLKFLPANATSVLQPLDQGIIRAVKARYRRFLLRSLVAKIDSSESVTELCRNVTLLDSIHWIARAWNETATSTITKCFKMCGFPVNSEEMQIDSCDEHDDSIPLAQLARELRQNIDTENIADFDENVPTENDSDAWEDELVQEYNHSEDAVETDNTDEFTSVEESPPPSPMTYSDVLDFCQETETLFIQ